MTDLEKKVIAQCIKLLNEVDTSGVYSVINQAINDTRTGIRDKMQMCADSLQAKVGKQVRESLNWLNELNKS